MESLFGEQFNINVDKKNKVDNLLDKISNKSTVVEDVNKQLKSKKLSIEERLSIIKENVFKVLGKQKDNVIAITNIEDFSFYIDRAIENGFIAIDTETNNTLDYINCKLMGPCIYTPNQKQAYIPLNHVDYKTNERLEYQLTETDVRNQFQRLIDNNVKIIMHNGKFDYQVIKCTCGIELPIYWDTMIAARLLDENEQSAGLKQQYIDKIDAQQEKYDIEHLFTNVEYAQVEPEVFAMYAATDAYMTYKLYEWQLDKLSKNDLRGVFNVFSNIEMPLVKVTAEMELEGVELDLDYSKRLLDKYNNKLKVIDDKLNVELGNLKSKIDSWRLTPSANERPKKKTGNGEGKSKSEQLTEPINLSSPTQLAILLYDILGANIVDAKSPRGTGEEILEKIDLPICKLLLERRGIVKLITAFLEALPQAVNPKDNRIHCHFNQLGTDTGRFSSSGPNLQQIPSHNKEIRMMFKARDGYKLIGSDFSAQEVRLSAFYSQDKKMIEAYKEGKDLYSVIAQQMFDNKYEDNLEFYPEGTVIELDGKKTICGNKTHLNKSGKERRGQAKTVLLGLLYGRGAASIGEQIGKSKQEGQEIIDKFFESFGGMKKWTNESLEFLRTHGYVEDFLGRRRRLPDIYLKPYDVYYKENKTSDATFNPFLICSNRVIKDDPIIKDFVNKCNSIKYNKDLEPIKQEALKKGIIIQPNTGRIAQAERQCVNARVQGGAASLTKLAMLNIFNDKELNELGAKMIITVHDEIMVECPEENAERVSKRLPEVMVETAQQYINVPFKCDPYVVSHWYSDEMEVSLREEFKKLEDKGLSRDEALEEVYKEHSEINSKNIYETIINNSELNV